MTCMHTWGNGGKQGSFRDLPSGVRQMDRKSRSLSDLSAGYASADQVIHTHTHTHTCVCVCVCVCVYVCVCWVILIDRQTDR